MPRGSIEPKVTSIPAERYKVDSMSAFSPPRLSVLESLPIFQSTSNAVPSTLAMVLTQPSEIHQLPARRPFSLPGGEEIR